MTSPFNIVQANLTVHRLVLFYTFFLSETFYRFTANG